MSPSDDRSSEDRAGPNGKDRSTGYGSGSVETVISVEEVNRQAAAIAEAGVAPSRVAELAGPEPFVSIDGLRAGYGKMEILHDFNLQVGRQQSLCLIGPNGAGKSTVLHSIFGFTNIFDGRISVGGKDVTRLSSKDKLKTSGIAYILQDKSVFPGMTVGERRLLEISRALVMDPEVLLVDEPSIGLEPRFIDMVFEILDDLQKGEGKTIIMVEQNAKKGLEFADIGYVLVSGQLAMAGPGKELLADPEVGRLFLGG